MSTTSDQICQSKVEILTYLHGCLFFECRQHPQCEGFNRDRYLFTTAVHDPAQKFHKLKWTEIYKIDLNHAPKAYKEDQYSVHIHDTIDDPHSLLGIFTVKSTTASTVELVQTQDSSRPQPRLPTTAYTTPFYPNAIGYVYSASCTLK